MLVLHNYLLNKLYGLPSKTFFIQIPRKISPVMDLYIYLKSKTLICENSTDLLIYFFKFCKYCIFKEHLDIYIQFYNKIQKMYHGFNKLALIWKYKHCKKFDINEDLELTEFSNIKEVHKIFLLEDNVVYTFNVKNLIKIIINGLTNNEDLCCMPIKIKNPYTNNFFKRSSLYKIYFKIQKTNLVIPELFYLFFKSEFEIKVFLLYYESNIKNYLIKNFNTVLSDEEKLEYIKDLVESQTTIVIHKDFPNDVLINTFYPLLSLYLYSNYSLNPNKRIASRKLMNCCLKKYKTEGCLYGRKIYSDNQFDKSKYYFITHI
jgi:hypothetical protein